MGDNALHRGVYRVTETFREAESGCLAKDGLGRLYGAVDADAVALSSSTHADSRDSL